MKPFIPYSLLLAAAATGMAFGQAYTKPVGYISLGNQSGNAIPAETDYFISLPLDRPSEAATAVVSVSGDVITVSATAGLGTFTGGVPYLAKITSGTKSGLVGLITANTATTVTVQLQPGEDLSGIAAGNTLSIQKAWTPLSLFAGSSVLPNGTQLLAYSGTAPGINTVSDIAFEFGGGAWLDLTTFGSADNAVLYPGEALVVRTVAGGPIASLVISGEVPTANSRTILANLDATGQDNLVSFTAPVPERLDSTGLGFNVGDQILLFDDISSTGVIVTPGQNKAASRTLEYQGGGSWLDLATFANVETTFFLTPGEAFVYRIAAGAPLADTAWTNQPSYVPNL